MAERFDCLLPHAISSVLTERLPLLLVDINGELQLKQESFTCCQGTGLCLEPGGTVHRCDLKQRFHRTASLFQRLVRICDEQAQFFTGQALDRQLISRFMEWFRKQNHEKKSWLIDLPLGNSGLSPLVDVALVASWQLGLKVLYIDFRKVATWQFIQDDLQREVYDVLILDQITKLWAPDSLLNLELLVSYFSAASSPSILGFVGHRNLEVSPASARPKISDRVKSLQSRPWQQCLTPYLSEHLSLMSGANL